jgi:hypothetical protein
MWLTTALVSWITKGKRNLDYAENDRTVGVLKSDINRELEKSR